jgi:hypothetical protein
VIAPGALCSIEAVALGEIAGVPLGFTDAALHGRAGLLFAAAAEDTNDTYTDGTCTGAVIGRLSGNTVRGTTAITPPCKLEGLTCSEDGTLWLVADADDRRLPAVLFRADCPW